MKSANALYAACLLALVCHLCPAQPAQPGPPAPRPRLLLHGTDQLEQLRASAATPTGRQALARARQAIRLLERASLVGRNSELIKEGGYIAAGHAAIGLIANEPPAFAAAEREILDRVVRYPLTSSLTLEQRAARLAGTALTYDMAHHAWPTDTRNAVAAFLLNEAGKLPADIDKAPQTRIEISLLAHAAAGLATLAIANDIDDPTGPARINAVRDRLLNHLNQSIGPTGHSVHGESIRQAVLASGILPFLRADRAAGGPDNLSHPALQNALFPMVVQLVPDLGLPDYGRNVDPVDGAGLLALAFDLAPPQQRPGIAWMFEQIGGEQFRGIVRPHQLIDVLRSGLLDARPSPPEPPLWPISLADKTAHAALWRTGYDTPEDIIVLAQNASLRIVGLGQRWLAAAGRDADKWSHAPDAGALDNRFGIAAGIAKIRQTYQVRHEAALAGFEPLDQAQTGSARFSVSGEARRLRAEHREERRENPVITPIPEAGPYTGSRTLAVDFSRASGALCLIALRDVLEGAGTAPRTWALHLDPALKPEIRGQQFILRGEQATLICTILHPDGVELLSTFSPFANLISFTTNAPEVHAVITLSTDDLPPPPATGPAGTRGLHEPVRIGGQTIRLHNDRILFGSPQP